MRFPVEDYKKEELHTLDFFMFVCFYLLILPELEELKGASVSTRAGGIASEAQKEPRASA